jgi:hypothetical protein
MGGVVQRVTNDPPKTEWLLIDVAPWQWTADRDAAFFFERYDGEMSATSCALLIAQQTREHVFPVIRTKPMPHKAIPEPIADEDLSDANGNPSPAGATVKDAANRRTAVARKPAKRPNVEQAVAAHAEETPRKFWWQER